MSLNNEHLSIISNNNKTIWFILIESSLHSIIDTKRKIDFGMQLLNQLVVQSFDTSIVWSDIKVMDEIIN